VLVRIRLAQVFGKPGQPTNHRTPSGAVVMTNEAATDEDRGPPRPGRPSAGTQVAVQCCGRSNASALGRNRARHLAQMPTNKPAGTRATTLLTSPGPDRATANPPPKSGGPRAPGGGASYASISTQKSPHPPREAGAWPACASRGIAPPACRGCFAITARPRNGRAVATMRSRRRSQREPGGAIVSRPQREPGGAIVSGALGS
jgi:hypothetical protein